MMSEVAELKSFLYKDKRPFMIVFSNDEEGVNKYLLGVYNTIQTNPDLLKCTKESIRDAAITSATLGVPLDARKYAYLVPYGNKAQFQLSYKGYIYIAKRDKDVDNVQSVIVYNDDTFSFDVGMNTIQHVPNLDSPGYGVDTNIKFVYAVVRFCQNTGRAMMFEVMTKKQIDTIKGNAKQSHIWNSHYGEMARKTVIKRLCKHAQLGDVARFDEIDNSIEGNKIVNVTPTGELLVDDSDTDTKNKILLAVEGCNTEEELRDVQKRYQDDVQELSLYNVKYCREVTSAMGKKEDELYIEKVISCFDACEEESSLDAVYNAHKERINRLKAKDRNGVIGHYADCKQSFIDRMAV
jgi:phage RecT family recombinase